VRAPQEIQHQQDRQEKKKKRWFGEKHYEGFRL